MEEAVLHAGYWKFRLTLHAKHPILISSDTLRVNLDDKAFLYVDKYRKEMQALTKL